MDTATVVLFRNGEEVTRSQGGRLRYADPTPGTYRVEVRLPVPGVLWGYRVLPVIYSNRIRVVEDLDTTPLGAPARGFPLDEYPGLPAEMPEHTPGKSARKKRLERSEPQSTEPETREPKSPEEQSSDSSPPDSETQKKKKPEPKKSEPQKPVPEPKEPEPKEPEPKAQEPAPANGATP